MILDVQPGRSDFLTEAKALAPWLGQPGVGLALDPEWRMGAGQVPGQSIGSVDAGEVNQVSAWLEDLVAARHLPDKVFLVHRFTTSMVRGDSRLADRPHLREIMNVDGFGTWAAKLSKYQAFAARSPWPMGLKLFTKSRNDPDLLQPADVLACAPARSSSTTSERCSPARVNRGWVGRVSRSGPGGAGWSDGRGPTRIVTHRSLTRFSGRFGWVVRPPG